MTEAIEPNEIIVPNKTKIPINNMVKGFFKNPVKIIAVAGTVIIFILFIIVAFRTVLK